MDARVPRRRVLAALATAALALAASGRALAHGGSLGAATRESLTVPTWLVVSTGGLAVGASFLLASFVTDRSFIDRVEAWGPSWPVAGRRVLRVAGGAFGVAALAFVVGVGYVGPEDPLSNAAVLVVWAGWWAGFTMSSYLVGNLWPLVNPWRALASVLPALDADYPERLGSWPAVAGLLALIWVEVVSPLADAPRLLGAVVLVYTFLTLAGAVAVGPATWFGRVDPVARVFRAYGRVAPVGVADGSLRLRLPGAGLTDRGDVTGTDDVAFVVALLWVTTFDGLVATPAWRTLATALADAGLPYAVLYPLALLLGFVLFLGVYLLAARRARARADTYLRVDYLAQRFAPPLLAIAAGYHVAHFLGYFLQLSPQLVRTVANPLAAVSPQVLVLPDWFGLLALAGVLLGHVLAIAAAHAAAFDVFPGRLQAIRSQYPFVAVMVWYTMTSLWVVTRPDVTPPGLWTV